MDLAAAFDAAIARLESAGFDALSETDRALVTVRELEAQVDNGGFDQYFFNSSGDHAFFAERALRLIGADATAAIVGRAIALFGPEGVPRDRDARQRALDGVCERSEDELDELDRQFYACPDDIEALLQRYSSGSPA